VNIGIGGGRGKGKANLCQYNIMIMIVVLRFSQGKRKKWEIKRIGEYRQAFKWSV